VKKIFVVFAVLLGTCSVLSGQSPSLKRFEVGAAVSYQSVNYDDDELGMSPKMWNIPFRIGYFVLPWLEVEPEIMFTKRTYYESISEPWGHLLSLNVSANFFRPHRAVPFVLTGAGFGNGIPFMGQVSGSSGVDTFALNFGGGVKCFIIPAAALRIEYRFSHFRVSYLSYLDETIHSTLDLHQVLVGVSLVF
jgi:opacity protein-like surface antigen